MTWQRQCWHFWKTLKASHKFCRHNQVKKVLGCVYNPNSKNFKIWKCLYLKKNLTVKVFLLIFAHCLQLSPAGYCGPGIAASHITHQKQKATTHLIKKLKKFSFLYSLKWSPLWFLFCFSSFHPTYTNSKWWQKKERNQNLNRVKSYKKNLPVCVVIDYVDTWFSNLVI